jgi:hypothetical protein
MSAIAIERVVLFYSDHGTGRRGWCYAVHTVETNPDGSEYRECDCTSIPGSAKWSRSRARTRAVSALPAGAPIEDGADDFFGAIGGRRHG